MKRKGSNKKGLQYVPGAAGDRPGFFPAITCQIAGKGAPRVLWIVHHRRQRFLTKEAAMAAADAAIALGLNNPSLSSSPALFLGHLRQQGFSDLTDFKVTKSFDEDRRSAPGDAFQPAAGEEATRHDPALHAALMEMVDRQIAGSDPPETRETFERLLAEGYSPEHARRMIGLVVALEITRGMLERTPFNEKAFIESLRRLPELPPL